MNTGVVCCGFGVFLGGLFITLLVFFSIPNFEAHAIVWAIEHPAELERLRKLHGDISDDALREEIRAAMERDTSSSSSNESEGE